MTEEIKSGDQSQQGPPQGGDQNSQPDFSYAVPQDLLETVEKFSANPADETVKKSFTDLLTKAKTQSAAKAEAAKKAEEAAKNAPPPDYSKLILPKDTKLTPKHLEKVREFVKASKIPPEVAQTILNRDNEVLSDHLAGIADDFKAYNENALKTLQTEWGDKFKENFGNAAKVVDFFEKQIPGTKAEIERLGLSNSVTANKLFHYLYGVLQMQPDTFERGNGAGDSKKELSQDDEARRLAPNSMAAATKGK